MVNTVKRKLGINITNRYFKEIRAFDSSIITIASSLAPHLYLEGNLSGIKISTLLNLSQGIPERVQIVPGKINDRKCIDGFINDNECLYLSDRGYYSCSWYDKITDEGFKFITRQVPNASVEEVKSTYVEDDNIFDYEITLGTDYSRNKTKFALPSSLLSYYLFLFLSLYIF
ncbi:transposase [Clostridium sp. D2Q-11]|uniref:Transposase n=1 Tax=Anaeromonas frigoriresistens TaxID=2683708 RepID=A0A942Z8K9_9FIRM|nr:transposase [Anaeromonas frigoriresistens]MBS4538025.1 transposase [Anaeromonas frigoriresistens]